VEIYVAKLQEYFDAKDYQKAELELSKMSNKNLALIALHADASESSLKQHLKSPQLENFWADKYHNLRVKNLTEFRFLDVPGRSYMELYCGYVLFLHGLKSEDSNVYFFDLAIRGFNSFHALQYYSTTLIENIDQRLHTLDLDTAALDESIAHSLLQFYSAFANQLRLHKTPGFLCLANITIFLARFYHCANNPVLSKLFFDSTWYHLHMAALLEKNSVAELNNAYFGKGIAFSNHLCLDSISQLKEACLMVSRQASQELLLAQQRRLEETASQDVLQAFPELSHEEENTQRLRALSPELKRNASLVLQTVLLLSPIYKSSSTAQLPLEPLAAEQPRALH
jgi:hypothetical protein